MKLILSFGSENAVCCWDFGHAYVAFRNRQVEKIREFGSLIQCTHVHDNTGIDSQNKLAAIYTKHTLNPREEYYHLRVRNVL